MCRVISVTVPYAFFLWGLYTLWRSHLASSLLRDISIESITLFMDSIILSDNTLFKHNTIKCNSASGNSLPDVKKVFEVPLNTEYNSITRIVVLTKKNEIQVP